MEKLYEGTCVYFMRGKNISTDARSCDSLEGKHVADTMWKPH